MGGCCPFHVGFPMFQKRKVVDTVLFNFGLFCNPLPVNIFINIGIPIEANKLPIKPPRCFALGPICKPLPVLIAFNRSVFCLAVNRSLYISN